ncbi:MAG: hypothetical protein ACREUQ_03005 [Burkholderiales bacterium]
MKIRISSLALLAAMVPAHSAHAQDELGRLFFTPTQRAALDAGKRILSERTSTQRAPAPRGPRQYLVNGVVTRTDGERTVWLNGKAYHDRSPPGTRVTVRPGKPDAIIFQPGAGKKSVEVKVSQEFDRATGAIRERYELPPPAAGSNPSTASPAPSNSATKEPPEQTDQ